jgi:hypothetical protein
MTQATLPEPHPLEDVGGRRLPSTLVDVKTVASYLAVSTDWVYQHADELGARRLGTGPKARLRFSLREVDERLQAMQGGTVEPPASASKPRRRPSRVTPTGARLLPIRGEAPAGRQAEASPQRVAS